ncbi:MAG: NADH-quinone oxidoreductase subunit L, partial [Bifidobacteriaceae bacterium]|nr:NADH-quinone oxidoreductase subunit L [Bifidobacteriaceae bacterium]
MIPAPLAAAPLAAAADAAQPAMGAIGLTPLIIAIPLLSAAILLLAGRRADRFGHVLGVAAPAASCVIAIATFFALVAMDSAERLVTINVVTWIPAPQGGLGVEAGLRIDPLSVAFILLVTFVGTLIHLYSV